MAKYTIEDIKNYKDMGIINEETASKLIEAIVMAELNQVQSGSNNNGGNKQGTGAKGGRRRLTDEEREAQKQARNEAHKAEQKKWAEEHYTPEERKAYGEEKKAKRRLGRISGLAYNKAKASLGGRKVPKAEWDKLYAKCWAEAEKEIDEAMAEEKAS